MAAIVETWRQRLNHFEIGSSYFPIIPLSEPDELRLTQSTTCSPDWKFYPFSSFPTARNWWQYHERLHGKSSPNNKEVSHDASTLKLSYLSELVQPPQAVEVFHQNIAD
jgi:hypothetical protein